MKRALVCIAGMLSLTLAATAQSVESQTEGRGMVWNQKSQLTLQDESMRNEDADKTPHKAAPARGPWYTLGKATFEDHFIFDGSYEVELQQYFTNPTWFRLVQPYTEAFQTEYYNENGLPASDFQFRLIAKGDDFEFWEDTAWVYKPVEHDSLVWFNWRSTGWYGTWNVTEDSTYSGIIRIAHPGWWQRWAHQDSILHNRVLSYQESGYPKTIQLAPRYYVENLGGWDRSQRDSVVLIQFPDIKANALEEHAVTVKQNSNSGIQYSIRYNRNVNFTATLSDGSVLGFYGYQSNNSYTFYFSGAITEARALIIPEFVWYNGTEYPVEFFGYQYSNLEVIDFRQASNLTELSLPGTIEAFYSSVPAQITDLHLRGEDVPSLYNSNTTYIPLTTTVWVPREAFNSYISNSQWTDIEVHYEGWEPVQLTLRLDAPGQLADALLQSGYQWNEINELTVIGHLNSEEMELLSRLSQLQKLDLSQTDITSIGGCHGLSHMHTALLPVTVAEVKDNAFKECHRLKDISLPQATSIGGSAFYNCSSLTTISLPQATSIGGSAFYNCSSLTSISLPQATSIGGSAFQSCSSLTSISLPQATSIGNSAFYDCTSLTSVSLPQTTSIGGDAFYRCSSLTSISLPKVTSIGNGYDYYGVFYDCSSLTSVSLPAGIQYVTSSAFNGCTGMKDVYCHALVPPVTTAFTGQQFAGATLHVPAVSMSNYLLSENWYRFAQTVPLEGELEKLTVFSPFTLTRLTGVAANASLTVGDYLQWTGTSNDDTKAKLTVSIPDTTWMLGSYTQNLNLYHGLERWIDYQDENGNWREKRITIGHPDCTSMIVQSTMQTEDVSITMKFGNGQWYFLSFPFDVRMADIEYPEGTLWVIRKYSGADRAALTGNTWHDMTDSMILKAGEGYILHCLGKDNRSNGNYGIDFTFHALKNEHTNNIFATEDVMVPLATYASELAHNRSWNLVGNPYPCYYNTPFIEHEGVITVWNGNGYTAYSLLDDDYVLRPSEAFFVQCPLDAAAMNFKAEGRTHEYKEPAYVSDEDDDDDYDAPARRLARANSNRRVYNILLSGGTFHDRARLVVNPKAKIGYEISCDASKFMSDDPQMPQLYILDGAVRYAIDERPMGDGAFRLGLRIGKAGTHTLSLNTTCADTEIILTDRETGRQTNLCEEDYTFTASAGTYENRFTLSFGDATAIADVTTEEANEDATYDMSGRRVTGTQNGVYVKVQDGKGRKVVVNK